MDNLDATDNLLKSTGSDVDKDLNIGSQESAVSDETQNETSYETEANSGESKKLPSRRHRDPHFRRIKKENEEYRQRMEQLYEENRRLKEDQQYSQEQERYGYLATLEKDLENCEIKYNQALEDGDAAAVSRLTKEMARISAKLETVNMYSAPQQQQYDDYAYQQPYNNPAQAAYNENYYDQSNPIEEWLEDKGWNDPSSVNYNTDLVGLAQQKYRQLCSYYARSGRGDQIDSPKFIELLEKGIDIELGLYEGEDSSPAAPARKSSAPARGTPSVSPAGYSNELRGTPRKSPLSDAQKAIAHTLTYHDRNGNELILSNAEKEERYRENL